MNQDNIIKFFEDMLEKQTQKDKEGLSKSATAGKKALEECKRMLDKLRAK